MWWIIICFIAFPFVAWYATKHVSYGDPDINDWIFGVFISSLICLVAGMILSIPVLGFTSGFCENYKEGFRDGYLTDIRIQGLIYETSEGEIHVGTGELSALEKPFKFSMKDPEVIEKVRYCLGKKVRLQYKGWIFQPFRYGDSSIEVIDCILLEELERVE